jgi:hypothetical protein
MAGLWSFQLPSSIKPSLKVVLNSHKSSQTTKVSGDKNLSKTPEKNKSSGSVHIIHLTVTIEFYMMNTIHTSEWV